MTILPPLKTALNLLKQNANCNNRMDFGTSSELGSFDNKGNEWYMCTGMIILARFQLGNVKNRMYFGRWWQEQLLRNWSNFLNDWEPKDINQVSDCGLVT